ncbi:MAG: hypothetical protein L0338_31735, partial [Acidobacteria bacterium]|nr:hypothetical protein [Acidobacteriota bacterium]
TVSEIRRGMQADLHAASLEARELVYQVHQAHSRPVVIRWGTLGLFLGLLTFAAGFVLGRMLPTIP